MRYDVTIRRPDPSALIDLKGGAATISRHLSGLDLPLPETPNTSTRADGHELYWIGPEHWLLRAPIAAEAALLRQLSAEGLPPEVSQVLVSDAYVFFDILGPAAAVVLAVASPLDTHPAVFPENGVTFTEAFGLKALVIRRDGGFALAVDRSFADMTADYLDRVASA
jgi:sarcosine oxidase subunit gamma